MFTSTSFSLSALGARTLGLLTRPGVSDWRARRAAFVYQAAGAADDDVVR